jgi:hypothetical protein
MADIPVKEIGELLDQVSNKAPKLLNAIMNGVYSEEAGTRIGKGTGSFYKELIASGIPADAALELTREYMSALTEATRNMSGGTASKPQAKVYRFDKEGNVVI